MCAMICCRRQIEKSPLAQIEMSLSTVLVGEFWADDGDCDEPDGDRPDERVAGSGCKQDQSNGSHDANALVGVRFSDWPRPTLGGARSRWFPGGAAGRAIAPTPGIYAIWPLASFGSVTRTSARHWRRRSSRSFMTFTWRAKRFGSG